MIWFLLLACGPNVPTEVDDPCGDAFDGDEVQTIDLELSAETWAALEEDYELWEERRNAGEEVKPYHPVERFTYQCQTVTDAMIRLKGNPCCSWDGIKHQFTIAFHQNDRSGRFQGLRKIALDAPFYDPSLLRERAAYSAFEDIGQPASRVNHVRLDINGAYYGLYANVEVLDKEWLQDRMARDDAEGTLWKLDYLAGRMEPRTNDDTADWAAFQSMLRVDSLEELSTVMDLEHSMGSWAAETIVNQADGYWVGGVNFYIYEHPRLGYQVMPWDLDNTWDRWPPGVEPTARSGTFFPTNSMDFVLEDDAMRQMYIDIVARRHARLDPDELIERIDGWAEQIRPALEEDPHRPYGMDEHDEHVRALRNSVRARWNFLDSWLDTHATPGIAGR